MHSFNYSLPLNRTFPLLHNRDGNREHFSYIASDSFQYTKRRSVTECSSSVRAADRLIVESSRLPDWLVDLQVYHESASTNLDLPGYGLLLTKTLMHVFDAEERWSFLSTSRVVFQRFKLIKFKECRFWLPQSRMCSRFSLSESNNSDSESESSISRL